VNDLRYYKKHTELYSALSCLSITSYSKMVQITSSFFVLASLIGAIAATPAQTKADLVVISKRSADFNAAVHAVPSTGSGAGQTATILGTSEALSLALDQGTLDLTPVAVPAFADVDAGPIVDGANSFGANIIDALTALTNEKAVILTVALAPSPNVTVESLIDFDLRRLRNSTAAFEDAVIASVSDTYKANATALKAATEVAFAKAINAYSF
jgi:hypothetical protein